MRKKIVLLDGRSLTLEDLKTVSTFNVPVEVHADSLLKISQIRESIELKAISSQAYYGINTGFGALSETKIAPEDLEKLQHNLILSHAVGVGEPMSIQEARALMLLRLNTLAKGHSGCRPLILDYLVKLLNSGIAPYIPRKGSVGASGDLAPLAHLAMLLLGEGDAFIKDTRVTALEALEKSNLKPLKLRAKEGLALINGTQAMCSVGAIALLKAEALCDWADQIGACSLEALMGSDTPLDPRIQEVRAHAGQKRSAALIKSMLEQSEIRESHRHCKKVQDAYSLRCMPQVHGATRDTLKFVREVLEREQNSATDNPLVFDNGDILSGGNFHGQPIAFALDYLSIAVSELANISERRIEQMLNPALSSGLPAFLAPNPGLNSGFMILQVTAAALVNENKIFSHPASTDSIPTSANREDHVSMGMTSVNKAKHVVENVTQVLAIELLCAAQALELRKPLKPGLGVQKIYESFRKDISFAPEDRAFGIDLQKSIQWLEMQL
ncbi:MAG: histidine ammonia-lyase [Myxococcaceae bacterium]